MTATATTTADDLRRLTATEFRDIIGRFASGVTVITTHHDGRPHGTTASAVSSLSLEPPMLLVCLNKTSATGQAVSAAQRFAVNILGEDQAEEAMRFATKGVDKFAGLDIRSGDDGAPLLGGALATIECGVVEEVTGGTHSVFLAEVRRASARTGAPLAYFRGKFGRLEVAEDESAFRDVRARVLSRDIEVGTPLRLDELAERVGLPRGPVFHALTKLSGEGLVTRDADGAFVVTPLTLTSVEQAMRARTAIELGAAELTVGATADDALGELRVRLEATRPEHYDGASFDMARYLDAYRAFHEAVVALAGSTVLDDAYRRVNAPAMIVSMTGASLAQTGADREATATAFDHHDELVAAYQAADLTAAQHAIRTHAGFALEVTRQHMDAAGGQIRSGERRRALLEERRDSLPGLAVLEHRQQRHALDRHPTLMRKIARHIDAVENRGHRGAGRTRHLRGDLERLRDGVAVEHTVDQPDAPRLVAVDLAPCEHQLEGAAAADQPRQALGRPGAGDQPEQHLGESQPRGSRGEAQGAGHRQLEPAAERAAVDDGDRRTPAGGKPLERLARGVQVVGELLRIEACDVLDVGPGGEVARNGRADDQHLLGAGFELVDKLGEPCDERRAQCVGRWTREHCVQHAVPAGAGQWWLGHDRDGTRPFLRFHHPAGGLVSLTGSGHP